MKYILVIMACYYMTGWIILMYSITHWTTYYIINADDMTSAKDKVIFAIVYWLTVWVMMPTVLPIAQIRKWQIRRLEMKKEGL